MSVIRLIKFYYANTLAKTTPLKIPYIKQELIVET